MARLTRESSTELMTLLLSVRTLPLVLELSRIVQMFIFCLLKIYYIFDKLFLSKINIKIELIVLQISIFLFVYKRY